MKNKIFLILVCFTFLLADCKKDNKGPQPQNVQNVIATAGYGQALFKWSYPDSNYLCVSISYTDSIGTIVEKKFSKYTTSAIIGGLQQRSYIFMVKAYNTNNVASNSQTVTVTPLAPPYISVSQSLTIVPTFSGAIVKWENITGMKVGISVSYQDSTNTSKMLTASSGLLNDSLIIIDKFKTVSTSFSVTVNDSSGSSSHPVILTAIPLLESKISKKNWTITADSQETIGEGATNGFATAAIDDNVSTYWHTEWYNDEPDYPHWIAIDMQNAVTVSRVELTPRQNHTDGFSNFNIDVSDDGVNWNTISSFVLKQINSTQSFTIPGTPKTRYIRVYATTSATGDFYAHLAEFTVYGSN